MHGDDVTEGFILSQLEVAENNNRSCKEISNERPQDFQARFIIGERVLRKEPEETYHKVDELTDESADYSVFRSKQPGESLNHPFAKYFSSVDYKLVFQRNPKEKEVLLSKNDNYTDNKIDLNNITSYAQANYSILKPFQLYTVETADQLQFQSRFECGNLHLAYRSYKEPNTYVLFMQNDSNTKGYNRWFYFSVCNAKKNVKYLFKVVNFRKDFTFFNQGLKPMMFSLKKARRKQNSWSRTSGSVQFNKSYLSQMDTTRNGYFTLSFEVVFEEEDDFNMLSLSLPYSYTKLINTLSDLETQATGNEHISWQMTTIAYSLGNNQVPYLSITSRTANQKKFIIILARQHPGETWASFFMEKILKEVLSDCQSTKCLLDYFVFKVFPMVNVDGVIYGNFRCDLSGVDLNRQWKHASPILHPQIYAIKQQVTRLATQGTIACCVDLHGHSKQYNVFSYSCKTGDSECRVLPYMFSLIEPKFYFPFCTFGINKSKETTARATLYKIVQNCQVLTIQSSFYGYKLSGKVHPFQPSSFNILAKSLLTCFAKYFNNDALKQEARSIISSKSQQAPKTKCENSKLSDSDSDPSCDEIDISIKIGTVLPKMLLINEDFVDKRIKKRIPLHLRKKTILKPNNETFYGVSQTERILEEPRIPQRNQNTQKQNKTLEGCSRTSCKERNERTRFVVFRDCRSKESSFSDKDKLISLKNSDEGNSFTKYNFSKGLVSAKLQVESADIKKSLQKIQRVKGIDYKNQQKRSDRSVILYDFQEKYDRKRTEEFPYLCVLSKNKREDHLQRINRRKSKCAENESCKVAIRYVPTLIVKKKLNSLSRTKHKSKLSEPLLSEIWKQHFLPSAEKKRHVFVGQV